jgi:PAS domain S-box-containing protein
LRTQQPPWPARPSEESTPRSKDTADTRAEESLRRAEQKFRAIFDNTSDGILLLDLETQKFTMCNKSCLQMLGYTLEEFTHLRIADLHLPTDLSFIHAQIESFLTGGQPIRYDIRFRRKDGRILFVDLSPSLVVLDGRRYILLALKDITERRQAQEALRELNERLELQVAQRTEELRHTVNRLQQLTLELSQAEDRERKRSADILHDDVQQTLAGTGSTLLIALPYDPSARTHNPGASRVPGRRSRPPIPPTPWPSHDR